MKVAGRFGERGRYRTDESIPMGRRADEMAVIELEKDCFKKLVGCIK